MQREELGNHRGQSESQFDTDKWRLELGAWKGTFPRPHRHIEHHEVETGHASKTRICTPILTKRHRLGKRGKTNVFFEEKHLNSALLFVDYPA